MPNFRIMKTFEFEDSVTYRAACSCGSHEHDVSIDIEIDKEFKIVSLCFYKKLVWSSHWGDANLFKRCWLKLKAVCKIIFTGYVELEEEFLMNDPEPNPISRYLSSLLRLSTLAVFL